MNHGIVTGIERLLAKREKASSAEVIAVISRFHRRVCGCHNLRHTVKQNIESVLAQETKRASPRWNRIERGIYAATGELI